MLEFWLKLHISLKTIDIFMWYDITSEMLVKHISEEQKRALHIAFATFCGINIPCLTDYKLCYEITEQGIRKKCT